MIIILGIDPGIAATGLAVVDRARPTGPPPPRHVRPRARPGQWITVGVAAGGLIYGHVTTTDHTGRPCRDQAVEIHAGDVPEWVAVVGARAHVTAELVDGRWRAWGFDRRVK